MHQTLAYAGSEDLDVTRLYRRIHKDEIIRADDLVREYRPPEYTWVGDKDPQGWYQALLRLPAWVGHSQQEFHEFKFHGVTANTPVFKYEFEIMREVTYEELELLLKHKEEDKDG